MRGTDTMRKTRQQQTPDAQAFDEWLRLSLCHDNNAVLTEPVPETMLRIVALSDQPAVKMDSEGAPEQDGKQRVS
jgi:hypothetical protein